MRRRPDESLQQMADGAAARRALDRLFAEAGPGGIRFDRFMEAALYDPDIGYYTARARSIGPRGDFSTSPTMGPPLARAVAAWFAEASAGLPGWRRDFVELGGGDGAFARAFLRALPWPLRLRTRYHFVEISTGLRSAQRRRVGPLAARWHRDVGAALTATGGVACLFSNEFVDAFPCRMAEWRDGAWRELRVTAEPGGLRLRPAEPCPLDPRRFGALAHPPFRREGQRVELHASYADWMETALAPRWKRGRMLTIDYGARTDELYHRRPDGTLRAYHRHTRRAGEDALRLFSFQDITCDVNFTDLATWGDRLGLQTLRLVRQAEFLAAYLPRPTEPIPGPIKAANEAFNVLEQAR